MGGATDNPDILISVRALEPLLERLRARVERVEMALDDIQMETVNIVHQVRKILVQLGDESLRDDPTFSERPAVPWPRSGPRRKPEVAPFEAKAFSIKTEWRADGRGHFQIDDGKPFVLPPLLSQLLSILSRDTGPNSDSLVGWKTHKEIAEELSKKTRRQFSKHTVIQNIYRLRDQLFLRGVPRSMIQTNPDLGVRFALIRKSLLVSSGALAQDLATPDTGGTLGNDGESA